MASKSDAEAAREGFAELQSEVLEWYGVDATKRYVDPDRSAVRVHVSEAGTEVG